MNQTALNFYLVSFPDLPEQSLASGDYEFLRLHGQKVAPALGSQQFTITTFAHGLPVCHKRFAKPSTTAKPQSRSLRITEIIRRRIRNLKDGECFELDRCNYLSRNQKIVPLSGNEAFWEIQEFLNKFVLEWSTFQKLQLIACKD